MRSIPRSLLFLVLLGSSAVLAQSHVRLSYEFAVPRNATSDFVDRFSSRGAHLDVSLELTYAFHLELSAGLNSFNSVKQGVLTTTDGDVSGKQFRYLNAIPLMGGFAFHIPMGHGSRIWAGVNGGAAYFDRVVDVGLNEYSLSDWQWGVQPHVGIAFGLGDDGTALFFDGRWNYFWERHGIPAQEYFSFGVGLLFGGAPAKHK
jgi:hypothetical protein